MSEEHLQETRFEDQFRYRIRQGGSSLKTAKDSYSLDLLGFEGEVPMLSHTKDRPIIAVNTRGGLEQTPFSALDLQSDRQSVQISVNESKPQETTKRSSNVLETPKLTPKRPQTIKTITSSALQGKRVIIRTNSMSGQKSLIFKQKTGGNVEIPAKLSTFLKASEIKQEVPPQLAEHVHPNNVAHVVFPQSDSGAIRHKPPILKRPKAFKSCAALSEVRNARMDIKIEEPDIFSEEAVEETKILPFDHDYLNIPSSGSECSPDEGPPPLVRISGRKSSAKGGEIIEIPDEEDDGSSQGTSRAKTRPVVPVKLVKSFVMHSERRRVFSEASFDRFQAEKLKETSEFRNAQQNKRSEEKQVSAGKHENARTIEIHVKKPSTENNKIIDGHSKKPPSNTNYEIVNTNLTKKPRPLPDNKNTYIVMIANKEMMESSKNKEPPKVSKAIKVSKTKATPPSFKIPFRQKLFEHKQVQTADARVFKNVETNTDDFLLEELVEKRMRERALQNKVSKTTNTEEPPASRQTFEDRITITPSPLLLSCDPSDILELLDGPNPHSGVPIIGENADFGTGPTMGQVYPNFAGKSMNNVPTNGKVIENCASMTDISYSRGKNIYNGWGGPEVSSHSPHGWPASLVGQNGRPRVESWKLQLFLDLKNCDQFDASGNMPLHNAVIQNNVNLVKRQCLALRTRQIDVNTLNHSTYTALQLALLHDASVHIVRLLLQHGADTSVLDPEGNNVLHMCVTNSSESITKLLLSTTVCADINGSNFDGYTPLIMCALYQKYVQADDLLSTGADPNISDKKSGRTPLFHAVESNDVEMVKLLLNHRALAKVRNFFGTSPHDAMFELDTIDPQIRRLILNKEDSPKPHILEVKGKRKRKPEDDKTYSVRPYGGAKNARTKPPRS